MKEKAGTSVSTMKSVKPMDFSQLRKELPVQWRVQSFSKYNATANCVAYIDARDVADLLDEVVGPENWKDQYIKLDGQLFCGIGIAVNREDEYMKEWVWKWDVGTESEIEKEKGEASDAFKRAAVKWGIGRFLYSMGVEKVKTSAPLTQGSPRPTLLDDHGNTIYNLTQHIQKKYGARIVPTDEPMVVIGEPLKKPVKKKDPVVVKGGDPMTTTTRNRVFALWSKYADKLPVEMNKEEQRKKIMQEVVQKDSTKDMTEAEGLSLVAYLTMHT